jgi:hypothetical protein
MKERLLGMSNTETIRREAEKRLRETEVLEL